MLDICKEFSITNYYSGISGKDYLDEKSFSDAGVEVSFQNYKYIPYQQQYNDFIPNLSVLDFILNCGPNSDLI